MLTVIPEFKLKIELKFENIASTEVLDKYGDVIAPAIIINETVFSQGHVPIIKKLARELYKIIE